MGLFSNITGRTANQAKQKPVHPKEFARSVGEGYVNDDMVWFLTKKEAEISSATKHVQERIYAYSATLRPYGYRLPEEKPLTLKDILQEPDTVRAMAILGNQ